ncbi:coatomer subunit delta [Artemisia annua]|uniref:Coatomer subunit delta n=1 Tax=Artemisia annua TaxID=35608 RepID=A0A2U1PII8_ARTAN|nr:coatomer subunit delta [Artemisia annua]
MEGLKATLDSKGIRNFRVNGILQVEVDELENVKFKIKVENRGSPAIDFDAKSSIDRGIFFKKSILGFKGDDPSFPAGQTRPLHWSFKTKDESNIPIKINCGTSAVGEHTKVRIAYDAFELFDLENVQISVPVKAEKAEIKKASIGRAWYDPGESIEHSKVHWSLLVIDDSNRYGSLEFLVPGAVDLSDFFPISLKFTATSTFSNLKVDILPLRKTDDPPKFVHHKELVAAKDDYLIVV